MNPFDSNAALKMKVAEVGSVAKRRGEMNDNKNIVK
jgi:hypothetical protein